MGHGSGPGGICDVCGFRYPLSQLRKRWDGVLACDADFEKRQPQDFVRAVRDKMVVPNARPEQPATQSTTSPFLTDHNGEPLWDGVGGIGAGQALVDR